MRSIKGLDDSNLAVEGYKSGVIGPVLRRHCFYVRGERILRSYSTTSTTGMCVHGHQRRGCSRKPTGRPRGQDALERTVATAERERGTHLADGDRIPSEASSQ